MSKIGSPVTRKFSIGTSELRIGPLSSANKLTQAHSVGLVDSVTVEISQESVDLKGGFPKTLIDTAIVDQSSTISGTLREYSRRNIQVLLGEGVSASVADAAGALSSDLAVDGTSAVLGAGEGASFSAGDMAVIYPSNNPEQITVALIDSVATDTLTLNSNTPSLFNYTAADGVVVYKASQIPIGNVSQTNYFSVQVLNKENSTGRPIGFNFWKAAISSGMSIASNADDFSSTDLQIKLLQPAATDYGAGGDLLHLADIIPNHAVGMYFGGGD